MLFLWEILVPCTYGDTNKVVRTAHHKEWDKYVRRVSNGLTILKPAKGQWQHSGKLYEDRVIPVRLTCNPMEMRKIALFTKKHYRQIEVMYYKISNEVFFI